uniref:Uncharacterized protein n=1 Tax=Anguilla anguilla TaxID=7936 RepID=A0A0E9PGZ8_ANGAN
MVCNLNIAIKTKMHKYFSLDHRFAFDLHCVQEDIAFYPSHVLCETENATTKKSEMTKCLVCELLVCVLGYSCETIKA